MMIIKRGGRKNEAVSDISISMFKEHGVMASEPTGSSPYLQEPATGHYP
jgi:hypothetical protein